MNTSQRKLWVVGLGLLFWSSLLHAQSDIHVTASGITREKTKATNTVAYYMRVAFMGGEIARSSGIRGLYVNLAQGDNGQPFRINEKSFFWCDYDQVSPVMHLGLPAPGVEKWLPLETSSPDVKSIRLVEGEAELFNPSMENGGLLEFDNVTAHPGKALNNPALSRCGVKLSFLGFVNAELKHKEWSGQRDLWMQGMPSRKIAPTINDSLMFSVEDPQKRIVSMDFFDKKGNWLPAGCMVAWARHSKRDNSVQVYCFEQPPASDCTMRVKLATPESLQRIRFRIENIPLPR